MDAQRSSMIAWVLALAGSAAVLVITAGAGYYWLHFTMCGLVAAFVALMAYRENRLASERGADLAEVASLNARYMGFVWAWGAVAIMITYGTGVLVWREWWQFMVAFVVAAALCLFLASVLRGEGKDSMLLQAARYIVIAQTAGMVVTVLGLIIDGKFARFSKQDWAANNVFLFGALAIGIMGAVALMMQSRNKAAAGGAGTANG